MIVMAMNPQGMIDFVNSGSHPEGFLAGLAAGMSSKAGVTAMWAHMVAGDICVTRWIWQDSLNRKMNTWLYRLSIFFGVMLMPLGLVIYLIFRGNKKSN
jgi:membrane protein insertase Oxa1/YidC/SpoIIIJ